MDAKPIYSAQILLQSRFLKSYLPTNSLPAFRRSKKWVRKMLTDSCLTHHLALCPPRTMQHSNGGFSRATSGKIRSDRPRHHGRSASREDGNLRASRFHTERQHDSKTCRHCKSNSSDDCWRSSSSLKASFAEQLEVLLQSKPPVSELGFTSLLRRRLRSVLLQSKPPVSELGFPTLLSRRLRLVLLQSKPRV